MSSRPSRSSSTSEFDSPGTDRRPPDADPVLAPIPRSVQRRPGVFEIGEMRRRIVLSAPDPSALFFTASELRRRMPLGSAAAAEWDISASTAGPTEQIGAVLRVGPNAVRPPVHEQGYRLDIDLERITIDARTEQGAFYAVATLGQLLAQYGRSLPCLLIEDWPDLDVRGVMLDVSRDKVPTLETVFDLVDKLAGWKINQLQLYLEHTFAYAAHPTVWKEASPFTGQDILELDAYCRAYFIELVPNQNCFGHLGRWLQRPEYAHLAEATGEVPTPWGSMSAPFSISPVDPGSIELVQSMLDELLPHFSSRMVNVGCDETFDVGHGRSAEAVAERGAGRVYLEFVQQIHHEVGARDHTMQFWGDIIERHPDLIPELPKDAVALAWGYEADHPFADLAPKYASAEIPFYLCAGTASWCSIAGRTENALGNLLNAAENAVVHGANGYLITDWGDRGHWQPLPVSYLGLLAGASYGWAPRVNRDLDVRAALSWHAFADGTGTLGRVAYELGDVYRAVGVVPPNSSLLFWAMQLPLAELAETKQKHAPRLDDLRVEGFDTALRAVDDAVADLAAARSAATDADTVAVEFRTAARMLRHGAKRGLIAFGDGSLEPEKAAELDTDLTEIIAEYRANWSARNRPGGLGDSLTLMEALHNDYTGRGPGA